MKKILFVLLSLFLISCKSYRKAEENIEFEYFNAVIIGGDDVNIELIPTYSDRKKSVIVKRFYRGRSLDRTRISYPEYLEIKKLILKISQESLKENRKTKSKTSFIGFLDAGSYSVKYKDKNQIKELYLSGLSQNYDGEFYTLVELIVKSAKLEMIDVL